MEKEELRAKLVVAKSLDEASEILNGNPNPDPERAWKEIENHRSANVQRLDLNELDALSGGAFFVFAKKGFQLSEGH